VISENAPEFLDRKLDGIFNQRKSISAVIGYFDGEIEIFYNPNANISLAALI
jgi:hypothetical protein